MKRKVTKGRGRERREKKAQSFFRQKERKKETGTMGRKKIQITRIMDERNRQVSPRGMGGWMSMKVEEVGRRNTLHPT